MVDFVDIDPLTYNLSTEVLERKLIQAKQDNKLPKIVVLSTLQDNLCDMQRFIHLVNSMALRLLKMLLIYWGQLQK